MAHLPKSKPGSAHSKLTRRCMRCRGTGQVPCAVCGGSGRVQKATTPQGTATFQNCNGCMGTKTRRCGTCAGLGMVS